MLVNQGSNETLNLEAGHLLTVIADAVSSGIVFRLGDKGGEPSQGSTDIEAGATEVFGPSPAMARFQIGCDAGFLTYSSGPVDLQNLDIERSVSRDGAGSFQPVAIDLELAAGAGTSDAGDTDFLAPIMGNVIGADLSETHNYIAGLIGASSISGTRATELPMAAVLGILMDGAEGADAIVGAHIDGGDPSSPTTALAAFGVTQANNHADSGVYYGLNLFYEPSSEVDDLLSGTAKPFRIIKAIIRSPSGWCLLEGDGAPVNGTTGDNFAGKGSVYIDYTTPGLYINVGTITDSSWKKFTRAA